MSLQLISSFTSEEGDVPATALTVVEKDDDQVNLAIATGQKIITSSFERIEELQSVLERVRREGLSRETARQIEAVAPGMLPYGTTPSAYTERPSRVGLSAGTESLVSAVITNLKRLILYLYGKIKAAAEYLMDAYDKIIGVKLTAYRLAQRMQYVDVLNNRIETAFPGDLSKYILPYVNEKLVGAPVEELIITGSYGKAVIGGLFSDAGIVSCKMDTFGKTVNELTKALKALMTDIVFRQTQYDALLAKTPSNDDTEAFEHNQASALTRLSNDKLLRNAEKLFRQLVKEINQSTLFTTNTVKKKGDVDPSVLEQLGNKGFGDLLSGLEQCATAAKNTVIGLEQADELMRNESFHKALLLLDDIEIPASKDTNAIRDAVKKMDAKQLEAKFDTYTPTLQEALVAFNQLQSESFDILQVGRQIVTSYVTACLKLSALRIQLKDFAVVEFIFDNASPQIKADEKKELGKEKLLEVVLEEVHTYLDKVAANTPGLKKYMDNLRAARIKAQGKGV